MNDYQLEQLLRQAADTDPTSTVPDDLVDRVRRRFARRRRHRRVFGSGVVVLSLVGAVGAWHLAGRTTGRVGTAHQNIQPGATGVSPVSLVANDAGPPLRFGPGTPDSPPGATGVSPVPVTAQHGNDPDMAALQARIARLQIARLQKEVARLEAKIKANADRRKFQQQLAALRRELAKPDPRDLAMAEIEKTAFLGVHRAEAYEKRNRNAEARNEYQQVVSLFPNTSWATVARERLNKDSSVKGEK